MTIRQKILKATYPVVVGFSRLLGKKSERLFNEKGISPGNSLYDLHIRLNNGQILPLSDFKGKKILLVNTASDCGFTGQYEDLQNLHEKYGDRLIVLGFPANDFKEQEKGTDEEIAAFCKINYGVSFPLAIKSSVVKGPEQNPVFKWLSDSRQNGWNNQGPTWNFCKYLVDENGRLICFLASSVNPDDPEILSILEKR